MIDKIDEYDSIDIRSTIIAKKVNEIIELLNKLEKKCFQ